MTRLRVGIIGTGNRKKQRDALGFAMAYDHAQAYQSLAEQCELVACADIVRENAEAFAETFNIPQEGIFLDYQKMLADANLDIVSICTWPRLHAAMVLACAAANVRAVHCEKPMSDNWEAARLMVQECDRHGVQLTFNHQRRFGLPFSQARALLLSGAIGDLQRIEIACGNLYDWGTHYIDMCGFYSGDQPADWAIGQIDYRSEQLVFGVHIENQAIGLWQYRNGVYGFIATGQGSALIGADNRLLGTDGIIEVGTFNGPSLRIKRKGSALWETIDTENEGLHGSACISRAIADTVDALLSQREPELSGRRALNATEIIFALYESSRRHGRIDLPLLIHAHPLLEMVASGQVQPVSQ